MTFSRRAFLVASLGPGFAENMVSGRSTALCMVRCRGDLGTMKTGGSAEGIGWGR